MTKYPKVVKRALKIRTPEGELFFEQFPQLIRYLFLGIPYWRDYDSKYEAFHCTGHPETEFDPKRFCETEILSNYLLGIIGWKSEEYYFPILDELEKMLHEGYSVKDLLSLRFSRDAILNIEASEKADASRIAPAWLV